MKEAEGDSGEGEDDAPKISEACGPFWPYDSLEAFMLDTFLQRAALSRQRKEELLPLFSVEV